MPCYHPKKAFKLGINPDTGKNILKVTSYDVKYLHKLKNSNKYIPVFDSLCMNESSCSEKLCTYNCADFKPFEPLEGDSFIHDFFTIPCGQCLGCRMEYSRQWAYRMMLELPYSKESHFITLTYDNEHVPKHEYFDEETGEAHTSLSLQKRDFVNFNKRLRNHIGQGVRFYGAGEYGSVGLRPHYHSIYFNLPLTDLKYYGESGSGFAYWQSDLISEIWPFGMHVIADVTFETCAYVARYVTKKAKGDKYVKEHYGKFNIEPEFALMSRNPGIGWQFFQDHKPEDYASYIINVSTPKGGVRFKPPAYYDRLYDAVEPLKMEEIKGHRREIAESYNRLKLSRTDLDFIGLLQSEKYNFSHNPLNKYHKLSRKDL